jgi:hypothetical protein
MKLVRTLSLTAPLVLAAACQSAPSSTLPVTGTVSQASFSAPVTGVKAHRSGAKDITGTVGQDGRFALNLPPGQGYRIDFLSGSAQSRLILPRKVGQLDFTFNVVGGGKTFDLGTVRYVGDPKGQTFSFTQSALTATAPETATEPATPEANSEGDNECEDGHDAKTGALCVDDEDEEGQAGGQCKGEQKDEGQTEKADESADVEVPDANVGGAVAEHNLPASVGSCDDDENEDEDDGEHKDGDKD